MPGAVHRHGELHHEDVAQVLLQAAVKLFEHDVRGYRAPVAQVVLGGAEPVGFRLGVEDGVDHGDYVPAPADAADELFVVLEVGLGKIQPILGRKALEDLEQVPVIGRGRLGPGLVAQVAHHLLEPVVGHGVVGQAYPQRVGHVEGGAGQAHEHADAAGQAVEEAAGAHVREEADADLGHGHLQVRRDEPVA